MDLGAPSPLDGKKEMLCVLDVSRKDAEVPQGPRHQDME